MKTCRELGISKKEKDALIKVRDGLESGEYQHINGAIPGRLSKRGFNMATLCLFQQRSCGSIGCIGGWVGRELGLQHASDFAIKGKMRALCYPTIKGNQEFWDDITPALAAKAITNTLNSGSPRWARVMKSNV